MDETKRDGHGRFKERGGPGRKKSEPTDIKDAPELISAYVRAFNELGGIKGLVAWAGKTATNRKSFYEIFSRLIPSKEVERLFKKELPIVPISFIEFDSYELKDQYVKIRTYLADLWSELDEKGIKLELPRFEDSPGMDKVLAGRLFPRIESKPS